MIYGSIAAWRVYATERGNGAPAEATDPVASAALQRASDYIFFHYEKKAICTIPADVLEAAAYEAANLELTTPGLFRTSYTPAEAKVLTEVDGIKWTLIGDGMTVSSMMPVSSIIEAMLDDYVARSVGVGLRALG